MDENRLIMDMQKNTATEIGSAFDMMQLTEAEKKKVEEIASGIDISNAQQVIQYAVGAQSKISGFADNILGQVRAKDSGYAGEIMTSLMLKVKELDIDALSPEKGGFLKKLPIIGDMINSFKNFAAKYEKLDVQIEKIEHELDTARMQMLKDIGTFDALYKKNLEYLQELDYYIIAGEMKMKELQEVTIKEAQTHAEATNDPIDAQKVNDLVQFANRFEKKVHDLKLSRMIAIQTAPQIRLIQNNDQVLVEKIQTSLLNTIPLWKNQIIIAIGLFRQNKALEMQKKVTDTTNELLLKNSEMLKQNSIGVAKESERGIVEIETLKKVNADLISTIEETLRIQQEGKAKRQQAEVELANLEQELKNKLIAAKN